MKRLIYILLVIVFFNISVGVLYYLGVLNRFYNNFKEGILTNVIFIIILSLYALIYVKFMINKFNYFKVMILGIIIGIVVGIPIELSFEEYLFVSLFTSFSFTFISYSIYFDEVKDNVFR